MAEFVEVIKKYNKMCNYYDCCEHGCPLYEFNPETSIDSCLRMVKRRPTDVEKLIINWSEPQYPTWNEWQSMMFPNNMQDICPRVFGSNEEVNCTCPPNCKQCRNQPIPARIANKLRISPKESSNDG